jgi:release factor glutamine methyltransferase
MAETVRGLLDRARKSLTASGIETAALDARLLLQHASGLAYERIVAEPDAPIADGEVQLLDILVQRRLAFEPVSRIVGEREFYGRSFVVTPDVLDPRADTETLIMAILPLIAGHPVLRILDLGTGSGILAITLLSELPTATAVATDISREALAVASANAAHYHVLNRLAFVHGNWFDDVDGMFDLIVSNPPYIPYGHIGGLAPDVRNFDPLKALDGGPDGLEAYRRIASGAACHIVPHGHIAVEVGAGQADDVTEIFGNAGFLAKSRHNDLGGHIRVLIFGFPQL